MDLTFLKNLKLRLQFTGWLQYIPMAFLTILFLLIGSIFHLLGIVLFAYFILGLGSLFMLILFFDLITVKLNLHPKESLPNRKDDLGMFDLMRARKSCRSFQSRKLTSADLSELMEYVQLNSGSANHNLIGSQTIRFEYVDAPLTVWPTVGANQFLVAIAPSEYDRLAIIDVGRCLQKVVNYATSMGLATCWIGPGADQTSTISYLGEKFNPTTDHVICVCAVGYKSRFKPTLLRVVQLIQHRRLPLSSLFFSNSKFTEPLNTNVEPFSQFKRCFEVCQWAPSSFNGQTTRCVGVLDKNQAQLARIDFYAVTSSRYYAPVALGIWCANWELGCQALGIKGHFSVLSVDEKIGLKDENSDKLPRYDVSWILDKKI